MNELIKIEERNGEQLVSGRELHEFLEVKTRFDIWFDRMVEYGFIENTDYIAYVQKSTHANNREYTQTDYGLKLSMAKEISMIQRNEKGKQARLYFIECEKRLKQVYTPKKSLVDKTPTEILEDNGRALNNFFSNLGLNIPKEIIASTAVKTTENMTGYSFEEVKLLLNKQDSEQYHSASGLLSKLGIKRNKTNTTLLLLGLQSEGTTSMQPYCLTELGKQYGVERTYTNNGHRGYEIKWKDSLLDYINSHINEIPKNFMR